MDSKLLTFLFLFFTLLLSGCRGDSGSEQSCADCVWKDTSQALIIESYGGVVGVSYEKEYARADIPANIMSRLQHLKKVSSDEYYAHYCPYGDALNILTIVESDGKKVSYFGNRSGCGSLNDSHQYVDYYEMSNILQLFGGLTLLSTPVWDESSERFEIMEESDRDTFVTIVDFTRDTLPNDLRRRLSSLNHVIGDRQICLADHVKYLIRVTDSRGVSHSHWGEVAASCYSISEQIEYVQDYDIVDIINMVNPNINVQ